MLGVAWQHAPALFHIGTKPFTTIQRRNVTLGTFMWGVLLAGGLASMQVLQPVSVYRLQNVDVQQDVDQVTAGDRQFALLDDQLTFELPQQPHIGRMDAKYVIVMLFDYACPQCRDIHNRVAELRNHREIGADLLTVSLPLAVWPGCNPHVSPYVSDRFAQSCEIAELSLAVWKASHHAWPAFDAWLWSFEQMPDYEVLHQRAVELVGQELLDRTLETGWPQAQLKRNVQAFGDANAERVPLTIFPGKAVIAGPIDSVEDLRDLLGMEPSPPLSK